ncbi:restriction endonuclease [filamentous cyanobacterium LEGE 11480]|uniref:Restriction endonuclease n=1 Tax=Romeriopsis navalis LEGE 11480 TaxID=2777977 RepID=A0A928Z227_9CYAN|nr:restriction endonuclease [Romeriopsis navalis]MBE9029104.1 restriction endonuclease [Romeriopsis navalis LEGE 11480]
MRFSDDDIEFDALSAIRFEELCYDLLSQQKFHRLRWNQGGADNGRDIEALLRIGNSLVGSYEEKWFFECKRWSRGLPVDEISSKFDWAEVEKAQHLVLLTNSYLTRQARDWVEKKLSKCSFRFHEIDGKKLKQILLLREHQNLIEKYFLSQAEKIFLQEFQRWRDYGFFPSSDNFQFFFENLNLEKLTVDEIAFLWIVFAYGVENNGQLKVARAREELYIILKTLTLRQFSVTTQDSPLVDREWQIRLQSHTESFLDASMAVVPTSMKVLFSLNRGDFSQEPEIFYFCRRFSEHSGIEVLLSRDPIIKTSVQLLNVNPLLRADNLLKDLGEA